MDTTSATDDPHVISPGRAALIGAGLFMAACLVFWASDAAGVMPYQTPDLVRSFTPSAGMARLAAGLMLTGVTGALLAGLLAAAYNGVRRGARGRHR